MHPKPQYSFTLLDDGIGMSNNDLINAMRLATNDPDSPRAGSDLGKFDWG